MDPTPTPADREICWFSAGVDLGCAEAMGLRFEGGGGHQSKTIMLSELEVLLSAAEQRGMPAAVVAVEKENLLGKASGAAGRSALANLNKLYSVKRPPPIVRALIRSWPMDVAARPLIAMLCALARDPLFRDTASAVIQAAPGEQVRWPALASAIELKHPGRFSPAMLKTLAQNCASSWTQSGHLAGAKSKSRRHVQATPEAAAFAALIAQAAGFGGPAILSSPWMAVLDASGDEQLGLLRRAQGRGLVRVRHAGAVFELMISPELTAEFA
jgi:hypothetical protein